MYALLVQSVRDGRDSSHEAEQLRGFTCHFGNGCSSGRTNQARLKARHRKCAPDTGALWRIGNKNQVFRRNSEAPLQCRYEIAQSLLLGRGGGTMVEIADQADADAVAFDPLEPGRDAGWGLLRPTLRYLHLSIRPAFAVTDDEMIGQSGSRTGQRCRASGGRAALMDINRIPPARLERNGGVEQSVE